MYTFWCKMCKQVPLRLMSLYVQLVFSSIRIRIYKCMKYVSSKPMIKSWYLRCLACVYSYCIYIHVNRSTYFWRIGRRTELLCDSKPVSLLIFPTVLIQVYRTPILSIVFFALDSEGFNSFILVVLNHIDLYQIHSVCLFWTHGC